MIHPSPTTPIPAHIARGTLLETLSATATKPAFVVLGFANTSYKIHLEPRGEIATPAGKRIEGVIHAQAKRIDRVNSGGRYVEPVFGRPRRVQGSVLAVDEHRNTLTVAAGVPVVVTPTDPRQSAADFARGDFVSFDVLRGATFTPRPA